MSITTIEHDHQAGIRIRSKLSCRRIPNRKLDQQLLQKHDSLADVDSPWLHPSPVQNCTVWWGRSPGGFSISPSHYKMMVVTELLQQSEHYGSHTNLKELCFELHSCHAQDIPMNAKGRKLAKMGKLDVTLCTTILPRACLSSLGNMEEQDDVLHDIERGARHPLSNLFSLSIQMPYQRLTRRYFRGRHVSFYLPKGNQFFD